MQCKKIIFSGHAINRMFERELTKKDIVSVIYSGEVICDYPEDQPYPSRLLLAFIGKVPVHVVISRDSNNYFCYVVTAYIPAISLWYDDYKTRRK